MILYGFVYNYLGIDDFEKFDKGFDGFFLSSTIMATTGFGGIVPKTKRVKMIIMSQEIITIIFAMFLVADIGIITIFTK